jgi:large subunit ribosomal protein L15
VKLHDLHPAPGSRKAKRRVGRGIAAGQGKTAGRGTKGQKARAGGKIPAWFEGGQTPLHQRIPKLRGFKNPFKVEYEIVNLGDIARLVELGELETGDMPGAKPSKKGAAPITVNQEILRAAGLVRRLDRPMKVLGGGGDFSTALFVVADAFSASARTKIEAAGGTVSVLEVPDAKRPALMIDDHDDHDDHDAPVEAKAADADEGPAVESAAAEVGAIDDVPAKPARAAKASKATAEPTDAPMAKTTAKATAKATAKPAAKPVAKATAKPTEKPAAKAPARSSASKAKTPKPKPDA